MKVAKYVGLSLAALLGVFLVIPLFMPGEYKVERSLEIKAPAERIVAQFSAFPAWESWMPWKDLDPKMPITYSGTPGAPGSTSEWNSENPNVGQGKMTLTESSSQGIRYQLYLASWDSQSQGRIWLENKAAGTWLVHWEDRGELSYPFGRYFGPLMDGMLGRDFEKGLRRIKEAAEKAQ